LEDSLKCDACHDRNGYPVGYSRSRDEAWLGYQGCDEIRRIPLPGPGCNSHPVTPRPDVCQDCRPAAAAISDTYEFQETS
jgi:hypothetical protein